MDEMRGPVGPGGIRAISGSCRSNDDSWRFGFACFIVSLDRSARGSDPTDGIGGGMYGGGCSASTCEPSVAVVIAPVTASTGPSPDEGSL